MLTIALLLALFAFVLTIGAALGKIPLWIPVLLITIALLLQSLPLR
jgi:hypothetical protein